MQKGIIFTKEKKGVRKVISKFASAGKLRDETQSRIYH